MKGMTHLLNGFLPQFWWKSDLELYLFTVNSKT